MVISFQFGELQWFLCPSIAPKYRINNYNEKDLRNKKASITVKPLATDALKKQGKVLKGKEGASFGKHNEMDGLQSQASKKIR